MPCPCSKWKLLSVVSWWHEGVHQAFPLRPVIHWVTYLMRCMIYRMRAKYTACRHHFGIAYTDGNCHNLIPHLHRKIWEWCHQLIIHYQFSFRSHRVHAFIQSTCNSYNCEIWGFLILSVNCIWTYMPVWLAWKLGLRILSKMLDLLQKNLKLWHFHFLDI